MTRKEGILETGEMENRQAVLIAIAWLHCKWASEHQPPFAIVELALGPVHVGLTYPWGLRTGNLRRMATALLRKFFPRSEVGSKKPTF